jgi:ribosomal protein S6--L-glutamate ligase
MNVEFRRLSAAGRAARRGGRPSARGSRAGRYRPRRVALLVEQRYRAQPQPRGLHAALLDAGHEVTEIVTDPAPGSLVPNWAAFDVVVARGRGRQLLHLLAGAARTGCPTLNPATAIESVIDKATMGRALARAGLPVPRTAYDDPALLATQDWRYPVICKPVRGDNGAGLRIVHDRAELAGLRWPEPAALVQEFLPNDGRDLKLYGVGRAVWAVRRASPLAPVPADVAEPVPVTPALRALARRAARTFGLDLYGVDCVLTTDGPVVIEVNDFPNYVGVPDAATRLATHVVARSRP